MKRIIFLVFFCLTFKGVAQDMQVADSLQSGYVKYTYKRQVSPFSQEYVDAPAFLNFNSNETVYVTGRFGMEEKHNTGELASDSAGIGYAGPTSSEKGYMVYRNFITKEVNYNQLKLASFPPYVVKDNWVEIKWELSEKTKVIAGYNVKKATAVFRGTKYTVWYTDSIPLPYGPLKLFGLPGVILEATVHNVGVNGRDATFKAFEVCYPCSNNQKIEAPVEDVVKTIEEEVLFRDNFQYYFVTESNKKFKPFGGEMFLSELPSERAILNKRKESHEKVYEWETKDTKRVLPGIDYKSLLDPNKKEGKDLTLPDFSKF